MKLYLSHHSLSAYAGGDSESKLDFFKENYLTVFRTIPPYIGILCVIVIIILCNQYLVDLSIIVQSLITGGFAGFVYFQWHCFALDKLAIKRHKKNTTLVT
jgi:hypothetical protein